MLLNKRKEQGFTLIELLAVIVVLAFIMVIIVPETMKAIEKSRKKTFENSMRGLTKTISLKQKELMLDKAPKMLKFEYNDGVESSNLSSVSLNYDGDVPKNGTIVINTEGKTSLALHNGTYCATKNFFDDDIIIEKKSKEECTIILGDKTFITIFAEYGELEIYNVISVDDGYIGVGANLNLSSETTGGVIVKLNLDGEVEWVSNYNVGVYDVFLFITPTLDGGYVAVGFSEIVDESKKAIIVKYSANGKEEWAKSFDGNGEFNSVISTTDGSYVAVGFSEIVDEGKKAIIVKYSANGKEEWAKSFDGNGGGEFNSVISTTDGSYVAVGFSEIVDEGKKAIIVKYDKDGEVNWVNNYGNNNYFQFISTTFDGGYMVVGKDDGSDNDNDYFLIKYSMSGNFEWKTNLNDSSDYELYSVVKTSDGGYIAVGTVGSGSSYGHPAVIIKYNAKGIEQLKQQFGDDETYTSFYSVEQVDNCLLEGYIIGGSSTSSDIINSYCVCWHGVMLKVDLDGNIDLNS